MKPATRDALLTALAKARGWIDNLRLGRTRRPSKFCSPSMARR